jgi:hypothetical protein
MASFFAIAGNLIPSKKYQLKQKQGKLAQLIDENVNKALTTAKTTLNIAGGDSTVVPLKEIGIGRPLSIEILTIYSGDFKTGFLSGKKGDLLCVSGVKSAATFDAASRAINIMQTKVKEKEYLRFTALKACCRYVYYTKALNTETLQVAVELDSDSFPDGLFKTIAGLLGGAAAIPAFMPAAGYLMAGAQIAKIAEDTGNSLFERKPFISFSFDLRFATGGLPTAIARTVVACHDKHEAELGEYQTQVVTISGRSEMRLVKDGKVYDGKAPYIILNIDGAEKPELEAFSPTLASTSLLKKFYGGDDKAGDGAKLILEAATLYNDLSNKKKADAAKKKMETLDKNSEEFKTTETLYKAHLANIQNDIFKKDM